jgi:hypothetical protein
MAISKLLWAILAGFVLLTNSDESVDRLAKDLMNDYVSFVYPGPTTVQMALHVIRLNFDWKTQVLTSRFWEFYGWTDSRLKWEPSEYGNISDIRLPNEKVWKPDIELYNGLEEVERGSVNVMVSHDGHVFWVPPAVYRTTCSPQSSNRWVMTCGFWIGSWVYPSAQLNLTMYSDFFFLDHYVPEANGIILVNYTATRDENYYDCIECGETYVSITANITIAPRKKFLG